MGPKSHRETLGGLRLPHLLLAELLKGPAIQNNELPGTGGPDDVEASQGLKLPHHDLSHRSQLLGELLLTHAE